MISLYEFLVKGKYKRGSEKDLKEYAVGFYLSDYTSDGLESIKFGVIDTSDKDDDLGIDNILDYSITNPDIEQSYYDVFTNHFGCSPDEYAKQYKYNFKGKPYIRCEWRYSDELKNKYKNILDFTLFGCVS